MREDFRLLGHVMRHWIKFSGRVGRREFFIGLFALMLAGALISGLAEFAVSERAGIEFWHIQHVLGIALIPLFVRRLHDQDRSGWLALILPAVLAFSTYEQVLFESGAIPAPQLGFPLGLAKMVLVLTVWLLALLPGTLGANRFGPAPRKEALSPA